MANRLVSTKITRGAGQPESTVLQALKINYDSKSRIGSYTSQIGSGTENTTEYSYGTGNQKSDMVYGIKINGTKKQAYTYDALSRLSGKTIDGANGYAVNYSYEKGKPSSSVTFNANNASGRTVSGDFNGDGKQDLFMMYDLGNNTNHMQVLLADDSDTGVEPEWKLWYRNTQYEAYRATNRLIAGDFNGDGKDDIAVVYDYGGDTTKIQVYLSTGDSFLSYKLWYIDEAYNANRVTGRLVAGDFNGDGKDDIAGVYDYGGDTTRFHVFLSTGTAFLRWQSWYSDGEYNANKVTGRTVAGDFNGDGKDDVAVMYDYGDARTRIHVFLANSSGTNFFGWQAWYDDLTIGSYNAGCVTGQMVAGDFDGNGKDDIAALYSYSDTGRMHIFQSTGNGFVNNNCQTWYDEGAGTFDGSKITDRMVAGDINGDGKDEIYAIFNAGSDLSSVILWSKSESQNQFKLKENAWKSWDIRVDSPDTGATTMLLKSIQNGSNAAIRYTYDANGNITQIQEGSVTKATYVYDALNQLVRENNAYTGKTVTYAYDNGGNIQSKTEYAYTAGTDLGAPTAAIPYGYTDGTWKDLLTSYNGQSLTYDAIGNPLQYRDGMTMAWQNGRQLAGISKSGLTTSYQYDDNGIRTQKTVNGVVTDYYLNGSSILAEVTNGVQTDYYYDESGNVFGFRKNGAEYYYIRNGQSDIIGILDSNGNQVVSYVYDSWGKMVSVTGSQASTVGASNPFRYRGYYLDLCSGLYYCGSRYYDPVTSRYLNADGQLNPQEGFTGYNLFQYCGNNPLMYL